MLTADRPALLDRGLSSYIENASKHLRQVEFVVFDDSKNAANRRASLEVARALARKFEVEIRFAGVEERARFVRRLEEFPRISKHVLKNALLQTQGYTLGQNRNALLLDSVGTLFLCVDDDTVCTLAAATASDTRRCSFVQVQDPGGILVLRDSAEACAASEPRGRGSPGCPRSTARKNCGRSVPQCPESFQGESLARTSGGPFVR